MQSRVDVFADMAQQQPDNEMIWYGLASEYVKLEKWNEAVDALQKVISIKPDYPAAFQMLGSALESLGRTNDACRVWTDGIEVANRAGAWKAVKHMEGLLKKAINTAGDELSSD
jgi:predicted Zn-dependent protease